MTIKRQRLSTPPSERPAPANRQGTSDDGEMVVKREPVVPDPVPTKSKRVRTGCLTCRERHLKCDEGTPDCHNCRKSSRECKRGVRLNFIDLTCKQPPYQIPPTVEWAVQFLDESRVIASEYRGGESRYPKLEPQVITPPRDADSPVTRRQFGSRDAQMQGDPLTPANMPTPQSLYCMERGPRASDAFLEGMPSKGGIMAPQGPTGYGNALPEQWKGSRQAHHHDHRNSDASTAVSVASVTAAGPPQHGHDQAGADSPEESPDSGMMTPPNDKKGERMFLNSPEELYFMQVFVTEVGIWMDSLDKEKHFSRLVPYHALKCPMLLNALLACGVKRLTLTQQYNDDKALFYYDTATTQLLRSLQNPERNTAECAATAVVLNVYEIMSEKPTQRMNHIAGARALIRECGWNAKTSGLGSACFWLNVGMELLSCLAYNWQTAWDPDQWGVDMDFEAEREDEEVWVHRIFHVVAKICNFRASVPKFQQASPHDEHIRRQARYAEWQRLKTMCDAWNNSCPRPMHPFGYLYPSQVKNSHGAKSLFPHVWLIKRSAIIGRLFYHTAQCLLAQTNPILANDSDEARALQQHHAHQVCGIVAHTKDHGVASVSIRSVAIVAEALTVPAEQREVVQMLTTINEETGWRLGNVIKELKAKWGWEKAGGAGTGTGLAAQFLPRDQSSPRQPDNNNMASPTTPPPGGQTARMSGLEQAHVQTLTPGLVQAHFPTSAPPNSQAHAQAQAQAHAQAQAEAQAQAQAQAHAQAQAQQALAQAQAHAHAQAQANASSSSPTVVAPRPLRNFDVNPLKCADFSLPNHPYQNWYEPPSRSGYNNAQGFM